MKPAFNAARLVLALARGAVEWLYNPRTHRHILRSRAGREYDVRPANGNIQLVRL
jgi:hypothetical protein